MDPTALESAESWATIIAAYVTAAILTAGAIAAFWKFFLQQPLGNNYHIAIIPCRLRRVLHEENARWAYTVSLVVENRSTAAQRMYGWWRRILLPDETEPGYDPNGSLDINSDEEADQHYPDNNLIPSTYPLASGESYADLMIRFGGENVQQVCYVEFTLKYRSWTRRFPFPWRGWEYKSHRMIAPVDGNDLSLAQAFASLQSDPPKRSPEGEKDGT